MSAFIHEKDSDGIITITMDMPNRSANVINDELATALVESLETLKADDNWAGVIITSAKKTFLAGADLDMLFHETDPKVVFENTQAMKAAFRQLETFGKPIVAAINGACLGGGLELALACHYRIAINHRGTKIGFPEVMLGLIPGGGGVTKAVRLMGLEASASLLTQGKQVSATKAEEIGLIHAVVDNKDDMIRKAKAWILNNPTSAQPWDTKGYRIPGGTPSSPKLAMKLPVMPAMTTAKTYNNYPAVDAIIAAAVEGACVDFDTALRIESRYFAQAVTGQVAKNMMSAFWYQRNAVLKGGSRPQDIPATTTQKVGIIGAGLMGHGIAYVTAKAGMEVVMKDINKESAEQGKTAVAKIMDKAIRRGKLTTAKKDEILDRILATGNAADFADCDLIIEAVFENKNLKATVTHEAEAHISEAAIFGSNTSTLPISGLAKASKRPKNFIGIHFFSPVERMELVEIIVGEETSQEALAKAFDYVLAIRKIPIVVNDSRGFYTSRCFSTYTAEGMALLQEGQHPRSIEVAGRKAGMPMGPLEVLDSVGLKTALFVSEEYRRDYESKGIMVSETASEKVLRQIVKVNAREGKAKGAGFYEYGPNGKKTLLWDQLAVLFPRSNEKIDQQTMMDRLLFTQAIEAVKCLEEGVITAVADTNIGSIFGWGFAPFHGGVLQFINAYGIKEFVDRAMQLSMKYGERFEPPKLLFDMLQEGKKF